MSKESLTEAYEKLLARCDDPVRRAALERSIAYALATHDQFIKQLEICKQMPIKEIGALAGPLKRQKLKPLKFNKSKAKKLALMRKQTESNS